MKDDYAIIVGLQNDPGLDDPQNGQPPLSGPENDANDFYKWIVSKKGGAEVPPGHVKKILSSDYPKKFPAVLDARPAELDIARAFEHLRDLSNKNIKAGNGPRVGRRLYIFMSGHGIAPTPFGNKIEKESALLMANADPTNIAIPRYHIPGTYTAMWFFENDCFEEIFLFMDCCRDIITVPATNIFLPSKGNADNGKRFCAFATKWSRKAREKPMPDENNRVRGIFTKTLMLALWGGAAITDPNNPGQGIITFESLQSYLINNMKRFVDPKLNGDSQTTEPDVDYYPRSKKDSIIIKTALRVFPVTIEPIPGAQGDVGIYSTTTKTFVNRFPANKLPQKITLPREEYAIVAIVNGAMESYPLKVEGIEI